MGHKTALFDSHVKAGGKIVDFGGWDMPIHYGSQIEEHHAVRKHVGMFDVSHMTVVDVLGPGAREYLRRLLANDVDKLKQAGKALYTAMCQEDGGILDDLIVYRMIDGLGQDWYRLVVNCGTREKDLAWIEKQSKNFDVQIAERPQLAMIAIQGPKAIETVVRVLRKAESARVESLSQFEGQFLQKSGEWFVARTGYTGEDGLEIMLPNTDATHFWQQLLDADVIPCGLGARDTLRLEAGMNLYGSDMDESVSPAESAMNWTVVLDKEDREFIGQSALKAEKENGANRQLVGLVLEERGVLRAHQSVLVDGVMTGEVTSGTFSPTLGYSIALARVVKPVGHHCEVEIRKKRHTVKVVRPPFVRNGVKVFK
ncbi:MAG: glycine cleavage system aminomethyltransferase GcvT [Pseudomonadales bacterium]|nr:glycine cleavage system aminomethyltransferase GcvT [Pseudomonadales bacterium]